MASVVRGVLKSIREKGLASFLRDLREEGYTSVPFFPPPVLPLFTGLLHVSTRGINFLFMRLLRVSPLLIFFSVIMYRKCIFDGNLL